MSIKSDKYNYLFSNVIPNSIEGIKIFSKDDNYIKNQKYNKVSNIENQIWSELFQNLNPLLSKYASKEYLIGLKSLPIPNDKFPDFNSISPIIEQATGWTLTPVAGFLDEELFFELNKNHKFPVTDIIRKSPRFENKYLKDNIKNNKGYTPEPDIFHDIQAHAPFLMDIEYAKFMWEVGLLGDEIIKNKRCLDVHLVSHNLKRLQNFAWWTYEYGLVKKNVHSESFRDVKNDIEYAIYGSGIISSLDEVKNVVACAKGESTKSKFIPYNIEDIVLTCFDYSNIQDRYYFIDSMDSLYSSFRNNKDLFFFEG